MPVAGYPMMSYVHCRMKMIEGEHCLVQKPKRQFLETSFQLLYVTPNIDDGVVSPSTRTTSKTSSDEECRRSRKGRPERHNKSHIFCCTSSEVDRQIRLNRKQRKPPVSEEYGVCTSEDEADSEHKSSNSSRDSGKSKKPRVLRPLRDRFAWVQSIILTTCLRDHHGKMAKWQNKAPNRRQGFSFKRTCRLLIVRAHIDSRVLTRNQDGV